MLNKKIKLLAFILSLITIFGTLSGCGEKEKVDGDSGDKSQNESKIEFLVNPEDYRGTTVTYATWKDPKANEDGPVIEAFEKKYGINVEIQLLDQGSYVNQIAASIAGGTQADIFFNNGTFPGSLTVMQPIDAAKLNLEDPIWKQSTLEMSKLNGHSYLVDTISNVWSEVDICVYNKKIFQDNNLTTPEEYYEAGKWTYAAFRECAKKVASLGKDYVGAEVLKRVALASGGSSIFTYANDEFSYNVDSHLYDVMNFWSQMKEDGYLKTGYGGFNEGKTGLALTNCFALKKTGYYPTINPDYIGVTYLPRWDENSEQPTTATYRGWGLIKGAKNPVAAGIFLREYLDVNNYDLNNTFHSTEAANFFFKVTGAQVDNMIYYHEGSLFEATGVGEDYAEVWSNYSPSQIKGYLDGQLNVMENMKKKANDIIATEKKWLDENF